MAKIFLHNLINYFGSFHAVFEAPVEELMKVMCVDFPCNRVCDQYCGMYDYAERAIKAGYRKIPENAVVLTEEELKELRFQFETTNNMSRTLPYVFTEQGIAMLSGLLKNDIAIQVSINIMDAFVEMRKFININKKIQGN